MDLTASSLRTLQFVFAVDEAVDWAADWLQSTSASQQVGGAVVARGSLAKNKSDIPQTATTYTCDLQVFPLNEELLCTRTLLVL